MDTSSTNGGKDKGPGSDVERLCPECGAAMVEFDRLVDDEAVFTWYACSREDCTGQWLSKKALRIRGT